MSRWCGSSQKLTAKNGAYAICSPAAASPSSRSSPSGSPTPAGASPLRCARPHRMSIDSRGSNSVPTTICSAALAIAGSRKLPMASSIRLAIVTIAGALRFGVQLVEERAIAVARRDAQDRAGDVGADRLAIGQPLERELVRLDAERLVLALMATRPTRLRAQQARVLVIARLGGPAERRAPCPNRSCRWRARNSGAQRGRHEVLVQAAEAVDDEALHLAALVGGERRRHRQHVSERHAPRGHQRVHDRRGARRSRASRAWCARRRRAASAARRPVRGAVVAELAVVGEQPRRAARLRAERDVLLALRHERAAALRLAVGADASARTSGSATSDSASPCCRRAESAAA